MHSLVLTSRLTNFNNYSIIRIAAKWYQDHLGSTISVLLITNDRENKKKAIEEGIFAETDNTMNYSTRNKTTTLINLNDVSHNIGEGFFQAPTSRQTITTTTTVTLHTLSSPVKGVKMSKAHQASEDDRASQVRISRKEYNHQQASK